MTINVRPARDDDRAYLAKTIARCLQETHVGKGADWSSLLTEVTRLLGAWEADGAKLLVAVHPEDDDAIVGYAIGEPPTLHHVYVRGGADGMRGQGVARVLLAALGTCSRYSLPPSRCTSLVRRMTYAPSLTAGYAP